MPNSSLTQSDKSQLTVHSSIYVKEVAPKHTSYFIEAYVLEDSWPLTEDEWEGVLKLKAKALIGPPEDDHSKKTSITRLVLKIFCQLLNL